MLQGFHFAPSTFPRRFCNTRLHSINIRSDLLPVNLFPVLRVSWRRTSLNGHHLLSFMKSISAYSLATKHQDRTSAHFRVGQRLNPYAHHYSEPFAFSTLFNPAQPSAPLAGSFLLLGGLYNIAMFYINILTNDLGTICIPRLHYLRTTHVIKVVPRAHTILVTAYQCLWLLAF